MPSHKPQFDFVELRILHHARAISLYGPWMIEEPAGHGYKLNASQLHPRFRRPQECGRKREEAKLLSS